MKGASSEYMGSTTVAKSRVNVCAFFASCFRESRVRSLLPRSACGRWRWDGVTTREASQRTEELLFFFNAALTVGTGNICLTSRRPAKPRKRIITTTTTVTVIDITSTTYATTVTTIATNTNTSNHTQQHHYHYHYHYRYQHRP